MTLGALLRLVSLPAASDAVKDTVRRLADARRVGVHDAAAAEFDEFPVNSDVHGEDVVDDWLVVSLRRPSCETGAAMELDVTDTSVTVVLTHDEAQRLGVALTAGCEAVTRAEYFIRTGLQEAEVRRVAGALIDAYHSRSESQTLSLAAGLEEVENPRRPRPDV